MSHTEYIVAKSYIQISAISLYENFGHNKDNSYGDWNDSLTNQLLGFLIFNFFWGGGQGHLLIPLTKPEYFQTLVIHQILDQESTL